MSSGAGGERSKGPTLKTPIAQTEFCFLEEGQIAGLSQDVHDALDWIMPWRRIGPDQIEVEGQLCSVSLSADRQTLRFTGCPNLAGEWRHNPDGKRRVQAEP